MGIHHIIRFLLLLLFTSLQTVAPLAHAHVNGHNSAHNVHIATADHHGFIEYNHGDGDIVQLSAHEHESAVVCMPPECRSSALVIDQPALINQHLMLALTEQGAAVRGNLYQQIPAFPPYHHPFSQAPPR